MKFYNTLETGELLIVGDNPLSWYSNVEVIGTGTTSDSEYTDEYDEATLVHGSKEELNLLIKRIQMYELDNCSGDINKAKSSKYWIDFSDITWDKEYPTDKDNYNCIWEKITN